MEDNLIFFLNQRRPQFLILKATYFLKMKDDLILEDEVKTNAILTKSTAQKPKNIGTIKTSMTWS
jgi:hypothetical protein